MKASGRSGFWFLPKPFPLTVELGNAGTGRSQMDHRLDAVLFIPELTFKLEDK